MYDSFPFLLNSRISIETKLVKLGFYDVTVKDIFGTNSNFFIAEFSEFFDSISIIGNKVTMIEDSIEEFYREKFADSKVVMFYNNPWSFMVADFVIREYVSCNYRVDLWLNCKIFLDYDLFNVATILNNLSNLEFKIKIMNYITTEMLEELKSSNVICTKILTIFIF